jgi:hypothetical protein
LKMKSPLLKNLVEDEKELEFQVLFLNHEASQVEVEEEPHVDFLRVEEHLKNGGSVFITSRNSEKLGIAKQKRAHHKAKATEWVTASYFSHV